jgi:hypothetical protein
MGVLEQLKDREIDDIRRIHDGPRNMSSKIVSGLRRETTA